MSAGPQRPPSLATNSITVKVTYKPSGEPLRSAKVKLLDASSSFLYTIKDFLTASEERLEQTDASGLAAFYGLDLTMWTILVMYRASSVLADTAMQRVGSTDWAKNKVKTPYDKGDWKCNLFVYDMILAAGLPEPPLNELYWGLKKYPPLSKNWADPANTLTTPGGSWIVPSTPRPGDVIAEAANYTDASGHMGIVGDPPVAWQTVTLGKREHLNVNIELVGHTISATDIKVVYNDWGFRAVSAPTFKRFSRTP